MGRVTAVGKDEKAAAAFKADLDKTLARLGEELKEEAAKDPQVPKELVGLPGMVKTSISGNAVRAELSIQPAAAGTILKFLTTDRSAGKEPTAPKP